MFQGRMRRFEIIKCELGNPQSSYKLLRLTSRGCFSWMIGFKVIVLCDLDFSFDFVITGKLNGK